MSWAAAYPRGPIATECVPQGCTKGQLSGERVAQSLDPHHSVLLFTLPGGSDDHASHSDLFGCSATRRRRAAAPGLCDETGSSFRLRQVRRLRPVQLVRLREVAVDGHTGL